jgi:hypothetical protein
LKLQYDEPLSNFAFNFDLRHYTEEEKKRKAAEMEAGAYTPPPLLSSI